jgi:glutamate/tyrosine decarboxylase-like PLP-dependent enzyme
VQIPATGQSAADVQSALEAARVRDLPWRTGRVFGYVYDAGEQVADVAKDAYMRYLTENALDPTEFPSLLRFETEVVAMCADHLGGDAAVVGNFTSGGTESIFLAVKAARDAFVAHHPEVLRPEIVLARTAHAAFFKAAHYLACEVVVTEVDGETFQAIPAAFSESITDRTCLLVASASGYAHGVVDPVSELGALALAHGIRLHVDGCIGAFVLPFFRELGASIPEFDFRVPGVTSMSMDLHKYGYCPKGASVVLYRNKDLRRDQIYVCASWSGYTLANANVQSSRSGGPMAAAWAVLHHVGRDGYLRLCADLLTTRDFVVAGVRAIPGLRVLGEPHMCLVAITASDPAVDVFYLADRIARRGWYVQPQLSMTNSPANIHLTLTTANVPHMPAFLADLAEAVAEARSTPAPVIPPFLAQALTQINFDTLDDATFGQLLGAAGLGTGGELPESRVVINKILDALAPRVRERVVKFFFNDLYTRRG